MFVSGLGLSAEPTAQGRSSGYTRRPFFPLAAVALPDRTCIRALYSLDTKDLFHCTEHFSTSHPLDSALLWEGGLPTTAPAPLSLHC